MTMPLPTSPTVLFVDDEAKSLAMFERAFAREFPVRTAGSAEEGLRILGGDGAEIGVVIADHRMPEQTGIEFLRKVRQLFPEKVRLLTTAYTEVETLIGAINDGSVYRFIAKPWDIGKLGEEIAAARESYRLSANERELLTRRMEELKTALLDEKVAEIGRVAIGLSHYVDNALCPFDLLIAKIRDSLGSRENDAPLLDFLDRIREHIRVTSENIAHLRTVDAPLEPDRLERIDLVELFEECLRRNGEFRNSKRIRFDREPAAGRAVVTGDRARLTDFFQFMIAEEIVSLEAGSVVRVGIAPRSEGGVDVVFEDDAPLHPRASAGDFLYPFNVRSANPRNFGVFLVCAYFQVRVHGGIVRASEPAGSGIRFRFHLPAFPPFGGSGRDSGRENEGSSPAKNSD